MKPSFSNPSGLMWTGRKTYCYAAYRKQHTSDLRLIFYIITGKKMQRKAMFAPVNHSRSFNCRELNQFKPNTFEPNSILKQVNSGKPPSCLAGAGWISQRPGKGKGFRGRETIHHLSPLGLRTCQLRVGSISEG